jgi:hypothetical protein
MSRDPNQSELAACLGSIDLMIERTKLLAEEIKAHPNQSVSTLSDPITFPELRSLDLLCKDTLERVLPQHPKYAASWYVNEDVGLTGADGLHSELLRKRQTLLHALALLRALQSGDLPPSSKPTVISVRALLAAGESDEVEFKSTLRTNLHTGQPDEKIQLAALKTIGGFLNTKGGTLIIGVADDGRVLGLAADAFPNEDKMSLHLINLIRDRVGEIFLPYVRPRFEEEDGQRLLIIRCEKGPKEAFVKDGSVHRFYIRGGNAMVELSGSAMTDYVKAHFK